MTTTDVKEHGLLCGCSTAGHATNSSADHIRGVSKRFVVPEGDVLDEREFLSSYETETAGETGTAGARHTCCLF